MKGELRYAHSKRYSRIAWVCFYILLSGLVLLGLYKVVGNIQTRSLPAGQIQLTVPYSKYVVGEAITFTITNEFNSPIYIMNDCPDEPLNVYRQDGSAWVRIHDQAAVGDCSTQDRKIEVAANGLVNGNFNAWHTLFKEPGKYRIVAFVEYYESLPYQEFEIVAVPAPKQIVTPSPTPPSAVPVRIQPTPTLPTIVPTTPSQPTVTQPQREPEDDD